eukprot:TRINITY_DN3408_c0_g1_i5.p2 TRINITY_DN3408_c0_g1~~TRINITY_DN3408_c0_g1_i5.p2  ORF type:complete len:191 (+),score=11.28 TRINITY_DN3408_c0_g1_i5:66-638(+)
MNSQAYTYYQAFSKLSKGMGVCLVNQIYKPQFLRYRSQQVTCSNSRQQRLCKRRQFVATTLIGTVGICKFAKAGIFGDAVESRLPKGYLDTTTKLVSNLKESIETELGGAEEREVRRKADSAKEQVREFVSKWRDDPRVKADASYVNVTGALQELGQFYMKYGQRSRLSESVANSVIQQLNSAELALNTQ